MGDASLWWKEHFLSSVTRKEICAPLTNLYLMLSYVCITTVSCSNTCNYVANNLITSKNLLYSSLSNPDSAILILSSSSIRCAKVAKSTGVKYDPCSNAFKQCWAQSEPSC